MKRTVADTLRNIGEGGLVPKERENFLIWIPEMAFAAFWEHIL
jgi:hypothetical protein